MWNRRVVAAVAALGLAAVGCTTPGGGGGGSSTSAYSVGAQGVGDAAPAVYAGENAATIAVGISVPSSQTAVKSLNITLPSQLSLVSSTNDTVAGGPTIEVRNVNIAPGGALVLSFTANVTSCAAGTTDPIDVVAKTSTDFSGSALSQDASAGLAITISGNCSIHYVTQPATVQVGTAQTSEASNPLGAPIQVEVLDGGGTNRTSAADGTITLVPVVTGVTTAIPVTDNTATVASGLATFTPGPVINETASSMKLSAQIAGLTSVLSNSFVVLSSPADPTCDQYGCSADTTNAGVFFTPTETSGNIVVLENPVDAPAFGCEGYPRSDQTMVQYYFTGTDPSTTLVYISVRVPGDIVNTYGIHVCWAAPYSFATEGGGTATLSSLTKPSTGEPLYVGLLPSCGLPFEGQTNADLLSESPCIQYAFSDETTSDWFISVQSDGRDPWRY